MINKDTLKKLRQIADDVASERGPFTLCGLFQQDEPADRWDFVMAADWVKDDYVPALRAIAETIQSRLRVEEMRSLTGLVLLKPSEPFVRAVTEDFSVKDEKDEPPSLRDVTFNGMNFPRVYLLTSDADAARTEAAQTVAA